jgi:hypothetical protein
MFKTFWTSDLSPAIIFYICSLDISQFGANFQLLSARDVYIFLVQKAHILPSTEPSNKGWLYLTGLTKY